MRVTIKCNNDEKVANYRKDNKRYGRHGFDHYQCCTSWWNIHISHVSIHDFKSMRQLFVSLYLGFKRIDCLVSTTARQVLCLNMCAILIRNHL